MRYFSITALALSALFMFAACGGDSGAGATATSSADATGGSGDAGFPAMTDGKGTGRVTGTIAGHTIDADGICSTAAQSFDFWTDGTDFASASDANGDGQYLILNIININGRVRNALRYSRDGETIYNGLVSTESFDGQSVTIDTMLGRAQEISANFTIVCG
jgi:hypothetical protein